MVRFAALTKAALEATRVSADDEVVRNGNHVERLFETWGAATLEERHQLLTIMLDGVYVDMIQGLVLGLKPRPEFPPLFNLGEPVTTGDSELVTGGLSRVKPHLKQGLVLLVVISWLDNPRFTTGNEHCGPLLGSRQVGSSIEPKLSGIYAYQHDQLIPMRHPTSISLLVKFAMS